MNKRSGFYWARLLPVMVLCQLINGCISVNRASRDSSQFVSGLKESYAQDGLQPKANPPENRAAAGALAKYFSASPEIAELKREWLRQGLDLKSRKKKILPKLNVQFLNQSYIGEESLKIKNITEGGLSLQYKIEDLLFYRSGVSVAEWELNRILLRIKKAVQNKIMEMRSLKLKKEFTAEAVRLAGQALKVSEAGSEIAKIGAFADIDGAELLKKMEWQDNENTFKQVVEREMFNQDLCEFEIEEAFNVSDSSLLDESVFLSAQVDENEGILKNALVDHLGFKVAWSNRTDVREAEAELAAREIDLQTSGFAWLKYIGIAMGFGKFYVFKDNDFARFSLRLTLSVPVLDFGETKNIKEMARQDRDQARQRIHTLAGKIHAEIVGEVKKLQFLERDLEMEKANLLRHEKLIASFNLRFPGDRAADLLNKKKMELETIKMRLNYQEKCYGYETQKLKIYFLLGIMSNQKIEASIIDEIIDFWQKG